MYQLILCLASTCVSHTVSAFGADGFGNAYYVEAGARTDCYGATISLSGYGGIITATRCVPDQLFKGNFE